MPPPSTPHCYVYRKLDLGPNFSLNSHARLRLPQDALLTAAQLLDARAVSFFLGLSEALINSHNTTLA